MPAPTRHPGRKKARLSIFAYGEYGAKAPPDFFPVRGDNGTPPRELGPSSAEARFGEASRSQYICLAANAVPLVRPNFFSVRVGIDLRELSCVIIHSLLFPL